MKDVTTFDQEFMYEYVSFNDGLLLFKNDLVQNDKGVVTVAEGGSANMQLYRACPVT